MTSTPQRKRGFRTWFNIGNWFRGSGEEVLQTASRGDMLPKPLTNIFFPGGGGISGRFGEILSIGPDKLVELTPFNTQADIEAVKVHFVRFKRRHMVLYAVYIAVAALISFAIVYASSLTEPYVKQIAQYTTIFNTLNVSLLIFGLAFIIFYIQVQILSKIAVFLVDAYFADSIAAIALLHLIIDLEKDAPLTPQRRKRLLRRISFIANLTRLIPTLLSTSDERNDEWLRSHFREMGRYIRERERWLMAPRDSTLDTLRQDFQQLAPIYIHGNYGDFTWQDLVKEPGKLPEPTITEQLKKVLPRFLGIILPLVLMGIYLWRPTLFPFINLNPDVVTLVFLAWFLLAIDANLKLGIIAGLVNLAKGIKELR